MTTMRDAIEAVLKRAGPIESRDSLLDDLMMIVEPTIVVTYGGMADTVPIKMILHGPACGLQHIDAPETPKNETFPYTTDAFGIRHSVRLPVRATPLWDNPPHRSHLCDGCGHVWRPADVPTEGVRTIQTVGKADSPVVKVPHLPTYMDFL